MSSFRCSEDKTIIARCSVFFLLLEPLRRRRGGLVRVLLAFCVGIRRGEALRQALEAPAERRDVGLLLRRELSHHLAPQLPRSTKPAHWRVVRGRDARFLESSDALATCFRPRPTSPRSCLCGLTTSTPTPARSAVSRAIRSAWTPMLRRRACHRVLARGTRRTTPCAPAVLNFPGRTVHDARGVSGTGPMAS